MTENEKLDERLRLVELNQRDLMRGTKDCQRNMESRMKSIEEWKDNMSRQVIAILLTSSISALTGVVLIIVTWALKK